MLTNLTCNANTLNFYNFEAFDMLPALVLIKDIQHRYIYCNEKTAIGLGKKKPKELIGELASTLQSFPKSHMSEVLQNDKKVIAAKKTMTFLEWNYDVDGKLKLQYFQKSPIYNNQGEVLGVVVIGIENPLAEEFEEASPYVSDRQLECLNLIAKGRTYKEVGKQLNICERTVRFHVNNMKKMLNLKTKSQLIDYYYKHYARQAKEDSQS